MTVIMKIMKRTMFIKSTVGIDNPSSMILILFTNKGTDITDMQTAFKMLCCLCSVIMEKSSGTIFVMLPMLIHCQKII